VISATGTAHADVAISQRLIQRFGLHAIKRLRAHWVCGHETTAAVYSD
jgi:hypothetical protein